MKIDLTKPAEVIANEAIEFYYYNRIVDQFGKLLIVDGTITHEKSIKYAIDKFECLKEVSQELHCEYDDRKERYIDNPKYLKICEVLEYLNKLLK